MLFHGQQCTRYFEQRLQLTAGRIGGLHRQDNGLRIALTFIAWKSPANPVARMRAHHTAAQDFPVAVGLW